MTVERAESLEDLVVVPLDWLERTTTSVFTAVGFADDDASLIADALVDSDLRGVRSHGVLLVPIYVDRITVGGVTRERELDVVHDAGAMLITDAGHGMAQLSSPRAMRLAIERARRFGVGVTVVRRAHHFGSAGHWVRQAVAAGCVGIAMSNTTPLMPAPGGSETIVGNNPLAIAVPTDDEPVVMDMALSAVALGKIRLAAAAGRTIPRGWATDRDGLSTTDAAAALAGMLLPSGGHKGFGLALMIDMLTGVLGGGGFGDQVRPLYREPDRFNNCSNLFLAIDPELVGGLAGFRARASALAERVRGSARVPGAGRAYAPGENETECAARQRKNGVAVDRSAIKALLHTAVATGAKVTDPPIKES
jgi:LDH2 family malate/lactate/ureidoglycolate dehydrogenase